MTGTNVKLKPSFQSLEKRVQTLFLPLLLLGSAMTFLLALWGDTDDPVVTDEDELVQACTCF